MSQWHQFRHITKLDPDKKNTPEIIDLVNNSGTDAIMISGTQGITSENTLDLYNAVNDVTDKPILAEPAHKHALAPIGDKVDFIYLPVVLNSMAVKHLHDLQVDWMQDFVLAGTEVPWDRIVAEGYIILNPDSTVAKATKARSDLTNVEVAAFANYAQLLGIDAVYIEYSGMFGDVETVSFVSKFMKKSKLFYGGGIASAQQSQDMLQHADTIFVGNIVYVDPEAFLSTIPTN